MPLLDYAPTELLEFDQEIIKCLEPLRGYPRNAAANALRNLTKAAAIASIDTEMSFLRVLTAEEEAATCLFLILRQRRYVNARKLLITSHVHKLGVIPFLKVVETHLAGLKPMPETRFKSASSSGRKALTFQFRFKAGWAEAVPPLNFLQLDVGAGRVYLYEREIANVLQARKRKAFKEELQAVASLRHRGLYSNPAGLPEMRGDLTQVIREGSRRVLRLLTIAALIFPYKERALLVQQVLDAFLAAVEGVESALETLKSAV